MENNVAKAYLRYVRISPRKIQIVCDLIMPRAQGRAYRINKRTSHVTIAVAEKA